MNLKKIVLIDPVECFKEREYQRISISTNFSGTSIGIRDPLGLEYISAYLRQEGYDTRIIVKNDLSDEAFCNLVEKENPFLVGFSVWTYRIEHVLSLAKALKERLPDLYIALGGYHPTFHPSLVEHPSINFVCMGEGEKTLHELLVSLESGIDENRLRKVSGIAFSDKNGSMIKNGPRQRTRFADLPFPHRSDEIVALSRITGLTYPSPDFQKSALQVSYSRGCANSCSFCPSGNFWRKQVSYRNPDDVVKEIRYLQNTFGTNYIYFSDLTFNQDKERVNELCRRIISSKLKISWSAMVKVDDEFESAKGSFDLMKESGCSRLAFGIESFDDESRLKKWQDLSHIKNNVEYVDSLGIITRAFLLMGFAFETERYYDNLLEHLKTLHIDNIRLAFVVPFRGTSLYRKSCDIIDHNFERFTGEYPIIPVGEFSETFLIEKRKELTRAFYNSQEYLDRVIRKIERNPHLLESFRYFFENHLFSETIITQQTLNHFNNSIFLFKDDNSEGNNSN